jgi:GTP pyrophosphokinase
MAERDLTRPGEWALLVEKIKNRPADERARILSTAEWAASVYEAGEGDRALSMADILADLGLDEDTLIAAMTWEALERGSLGSEDLEKRFGKNPASLARGLCRIAGLPSANRTVQEAENIRKMLFAMVQDIRVIFIKLADRLQRLRTLEESPPEERKRTAQECLDIYAALAGRLGISWIKDELEDLALKNLNREAYNQIKEIVSAKKGERRVFLNRVQEDIRNEAAAAGIAAEVESRAKHFYSIYQKMRKRGKAAGDLYDLFGIRILCGSVENCYTLLGLVHRRWKPLDGRFKDYIAMPKSNGYQSLHTTIMVPAEEPNPAASEGFSPRLQDDRVVEIQIRTQEMHHIAENGIASHWLYKKGSVREIVRPLDISIVNRLKDWKRTEAEKGAGESSESFLEDIKRELLRDSIYVFTPQGKVIELPSGASPIDFAYSIHSAIGDHCAGARADGSIIPLSFELANTQVVEILTSPAAHPHINWLRIVKTAKARNKIRGWLQQNDPSVIIEKNVVARKKAQETPPPSPPPESPAPALYVVPPGADTSIFHVKVEDEKNMMIRFAKCCRPITGDPIIGYVSRGRGITVHRKNCRNLANIPDFAERKIETQWENPGSTLVRRFRIEAKMSADLFSEIEGVLRKYQGHLVEGRLEETSPHRLTGFFTVQLESAEDYKKVLKSLRGIPPVFSIQSWT